jgi:hypothetical protein
MRDAGTRRPSSVNATGRIMHCQERTPLNRIADICADEAEVLALALLRFVAAGYLTSDVACWDAAYEKAEQALGPVEGPLAVAAVTGIMRAVRRERRADWHFMPATCCRATEDEGRLIGMIGLARRESWAELAGRAAEFAGAEEAPRILASLQAAAGMLSVLQPRLVHRRSTATRTAAIH